MPRLAANLGYLFAERPPMERFAAAAAAGFKAVELLFPMTSRLRMRGARSTESPHDAGRQHAPCRRRRTRAGVCRGVKPNSTPRFARRSTMRRRSAPPRSIAWPAWCHRSSGRQARRPSSRRHDSGGRSRGEQRLTLLVEPLNRRRYRPNYLIQRPEHAAELIARIGRPNVRIQFDFYHVQIEGGDLIKTRFERHLPLIGHVQITAVPSRAEPDEGEVNYPAILAMLDRSNYAGYVSCEYKPRGRTEDGLSWAARYLGK